jgi:hypothetical protein
MGALDGEAGLVVGDLDNLAAFAGEGDHPLTLL